MEISYEIERACDVRKFKKITMTAFKVYTCSFVLINLYDWFFETRFCKIVSKFHSFKKKKKKTFGYKSSNFFWSKISFQWKKKTIKEKCIWNSVNWQLEITFGLRNRLICFEWIRIILPSIDNVFIANGIGNQDFDKARQKSRLFWYSKILEQIDRINKYKLIK